MFNFHIALETVSKKIKTKENQNRLSSTIEGAKENIKCVHSVKLCFASHFNFQSKLCSLKFYVCFNFLSVHRKSSWNFVIFETNDEKFLVYIYLIKPNVCNTELPQESASVVLYNWDLISRNKD